MLAEDMTSNMHIMLGYGLLAASFSAEHQRTLRNLGRDILEADLW